jgi:hypothetical protein
VTAQAQSSKNPIDNKLRGGIVTYPYSCGMVMVVVIVTGILYANAGWRILMIDDVLRSSAGDY